MMSAVGGMLIRRRDWFGMCGEVDYPLFGACPERFLGLGR